MLVALSAFLATLLSGPPAHPHLPSGAGVRHDIAYGADPAQKLDLYLPAHPRDAPVLFLVHGGAWVGGDKDLDRVVDNKAAHWTAQGYVLVFVNYRLSPKADPLGQADDVARALAFAQAHARAWGGDPARFVLIGHSAGGHLVNLLAADPAIARAEGAGPWLGTVALDAAGYDVVAIMKARHPAFFDEVFGSDPVGWMEVSPLLRLNQRPAPLLLVCSTVRNDGCPEPKAFAARARSLGGDAQLLTVPLSHAQISEQLGLDSDYTRAIDGFLVKVGAGPSAGP